MRVNVRSTLGSARDSPRMKPSCDLLTGSRPSSPHRSFAQPAEQEQPPLALHSPFMLQSRASRQGQSIRLQEALPVEGVPEPEYRATLLRPKHLPRSAGWAAPP